MNEENKIRSFLHVKLKEHGKFNRERLRNYIAKELGVKREQVHSVIQSEIEQGDVFQPHENVIKLTS